MKEHFGYVFTPRVTGFFKPDKGMFVRSLEISGATPRESIMIGDDYKLDIVPAESLGLQTFRVESEKSWTSILNQVEKLRQAYKEKI